MTSQQLADVLLAQWQLLWPLGPIERKRRFAEIVKDYDYAETLENVREAMREAA